MKNIGTGQASLEVTPRIQDSTISLILGEITAYHLSLISNTGLHSR